MDPPARCNTTAASTLFNEEPALWSWLAALLSTLFACHFGLSLILFLGRNATPRWATGHDEGLISGPRGEGRAYVLLVLLAATLLHLCLLLQLAPPTAQLCRAGGWLGHLGLSTLSTSVLAKLQHVMANRHDPDLLRVPLEARKLLAAVGVVGGVVCFLLLLRTVLPSQGFEVRGDGGEISSPVRCADGQESWLALVTLQGLLFSLAVVQTFSVQGVAALHTQP